MFIAVPFSMYYDEIAKWGILSAGIVTVIIGLLLYFFKQTYKYKHSKKGRILNRNIRMVDTFINRNDSLSFFRGNSKYNKRFF